MRMNPQLIIFHTRIHPVLFEIQKILFDDHLGKIKEQRTHNTSSHHL